jgi:hypothetical protein
MPTRDELQHWLLNKPQTEEMIMIMMMLPHRQTRSPFLLAEETNPKHKQTKERRRRRQVYRISSSPKLHLTIQTESHCQNQGLEAIPTPQKTIRFG